MIHCHDCGRPADEPAPHVHGAGHCYVCTDPPDAWMILEHDGPELLTWCPDCTARRMAMAS